MKKIHAGIIYSAILITLLASISLLPVSVILSQISFGSGTAPYDNYDTNTTDAKNIIIAPPELYEQAKSLKIFHDGKGISTDVVNITWIYAHYVNASDPPYGGYKNHSLAGWDNIKGYNYSLAKRLVAFLGDTKEHPNLRYVTLFGNARLVPPSYYSYIDYDVTYNNWIPTDIFYASPDHDLFPQYMVGRLPVNTQEEAEHVVQKITDWDEHVSWDWFRNVDLVGGQLFFTHYYYGELITTDTINRNFFNGMNITKLFKTDGTLTKSDVAYALSGDTGMIYIISFGDGESIHESYYFELGVNDLLALPPNPKTPVVVSLACSNGAFDTHLYKKDFALSFGEAVLLSNASGIAYIGGARDTYALSTFYLDNGYLRITNETYMGGMLANVFEAYHNGSNTLGAITRRALMKFVAENDFSDKKNFVTLFEFVLLGDPALELPAQQPGYSYQQPESTALDPVGYVADTYGEIPWYNTNTSITIHTTTDSPTVYTKRIDTVAGTTVERWANKTVDGAFDYTFTSTIETEYLVRTASEDGKEGWLYLNVLLPVRNTNTSESFATNVVSNNNSFMCVCSVKSTKREDI